MKQLTLESSSFTSGTTIPHTYTCQGENVSPQLHWQSEPADDAIKSYLVILDDPDAQRVISRTFVHWIVLLPNKTTSLPEAASSAQESIIEHFGGIELRNDFKRTSYGGPCPPKGSGVHTYRFTLFALSEDMQSIKAKLPEAPFTAEQADERLKAVTLGKARITGDYTQD